MTLRLSQRVQRVSLSANAAAKSRATELREAGRDILDLTTGEPDFDTPEHIKQAAYKAIAGVRSTTVRVLWRAPGAYVQFTDLLEHLRPGDLMVFNNTRVIPARLFGQKASGGKLESPGYC